MKAVWPDIASNGVPFPPNDVGRIAQQSGREKGGKKERTSYKGDWYCTVEASHTKISPRLWVTVQRM